MKNFSIKIQKSLTYLIATLVLFLISQDSFAQKKLPIKSHDFVEIINLIPDIVLEIRYATTQNFLKEPVYESSKAFLKRSSSLKLKKAAEELRKKNFRLKLYDAYRPLSVQKKMWKLVPNPRYVADPKKGSIHNRGGAVDVSLVTLEGKAVEMPTDYDEFKPEARHQHPNWSPQARKNVEILKSAMENAGFKSIPSEWWHYNDPEQSQSTILDISFKELEKSKLTKVDSE